ncbi:MAG: hypothetical protein Q8J88_15615 [Bacteroidales bacterium]|nr:hypothetical protein [Bacteroidales bacterium]
MYKIIEIDIGPLTSINSLHKYIAPRLAKLRAAYRKGESPKVLWDASQLTYGQVSMAGLTAFISIAHNISSFIGQPQKIIFDWKPDLLGFLRDVSFVEISKNLNVFEFDSERIGGILTEKTNPNTKIIYYADVIRESLDPKEFVIHKNHLKTKIRPNFNLRCSEIFKGLDIKLENTVSKTAVELIVNSLVHGKSIVFVGLQRTSKRVTVAISDSGIGFPKSLQNNFPELKNKDLLDHTQGLLLGCIIQTNEHGIRLALNDILNLESILYKDILSNDGWLVVSSYDTEIRWQKSNWLQVLSTVDNNNIFESVIHPNELIGEPIEYKIQLEDKKTGYWQKFDNYIRGSRFVFEIPIHN